MDGVGLEDFVVGMLFVVADAGIRGGGMEPCFNGLLSAFSAWGWPLPFFDALRFHDRLSFLLSDVMDEGVGGSSGLDSGGGDLGGFIVTGLGARGPEGLVWWTADSVEGVSSGALKSPPVLDLLRKAASI